MGILGGLANAATRIFTRRDPSNSRILFSWNENRKHRTEIQLDFSQGNEMFIVEFGRHNSCQVKCPEEATYISRKHGRIIFNKHNHSVYFKNTGSKPTFWTLGGSENWTKIKKDDVVEITTPFHVKIQDRKFSMVLNVERE